METYLIGLLVILIVILIGLVYFMSKQVRENDTKLKINIKDLEALRNKVAEMDGLLNAQFHQGEEIQFDGEMFERDEPELMQEGGVDEEDVVLDDPEYDVDDEPEIEDVTEESVVEEEVVQEETVEDVVEEVVDEVVDEVVPEDSVEDVVDEEVVPEDSVEDVVDEEVVPEDSVEDVVEEVVPDDIVDDVLDKVLNNPKKKKYKQPSSKAKDYEVGHRMESDNDGQTYEVVTDSRNRPRWKRVSE
jgi:hypothetical protein